MALAIVQYSKFAIRINTHYNLTILKFHFHSNAILVYYITSPEFRMLYR